MKTDTVYPREITKPAKFCGPTIALENRMIQDLRFALRFLRGSLGFASVAAITLALGIAANTIVFAWIDAVLLHPIPGVERADELAAIEAVGPQGSRVSSFQHPDFRDYQREMQLVSGVIAAHTTYFTIGADDHAQRALGQVVSANFFAVLAVKPLRGRLLLASEDRDDPGAFPIAVISERLWRSYFGSDDHAIGRTVRINGRQITVVGVAPADFRGTVGGATLDVWMPLSQATQIGSLNTWAARDRNARFLDIIVRRKPGISVEQISADAQAVSARIAAAYPETHRGVVAVAVPIGHASYGLQNTLGDALRILMAVSVLVLLIVCANVTNLLMARSVTRRQEFGIRVAIGAGRRHLLRLVSMEVAILAGVGAAIAWLLAGWGSESMLLFLPTLDSSTRAAVEPFLHLQPSASVLAFCTLITAGAAALSIAMPALFAGRVDVNEALKEGGRGGVDGAPSRAARSVLVIAEVALTSTALIGAAVAVRTYQKFSAVQPGFDTQNVIVAHLYLSTNGYRLAKEKDFSRNLRLRLEDSGGIQSVATADSVPLSFLSPGDERAQVEGSDRVAVTMARSARVSPGYFELMRIPIVSGRDFTERDDERAPRVLIVNQTFVKRFFNDRNPIGRKVRVSDDDTTVVGVVRDAKYRSLGEGPTPLMYTAFRQAFYSGHNHLLYVRAKDTGVAEMAVKREVAALDPNSAVLETMTLAAYTEGGLFQQRVAAGLLSVLGILSLVLAAIGLYSVIAYGVNQRTHEIGVRMALGARPAALLGMVLREGVGLTTVGVVAGEVAAVALVQFFGSTLTSAGVAAEPAVFVAAAACLMVIAAVASWLPARRATRVDPLRALRGQ